MEILVKVRQQIPRKGEFVEPGDIVELTFEIKTKQLKNELIIWYKKNKRSFPWRETKDHGKF